MNATETMTMRSAIEWADYWLAAYGEHSVVYYQPGQDQYGRDGVFYVRRSNLPAPDGTVTVYRTSQP